LRIHKSARWLQAKSPLKEITAMAIVEDALFHAAAEEAAGTAAREG
jgi:hypothetical protein